MDASTLATIPAELRCHIYTLALVENHPIERATPVYPSRTWTAPALLQSCRQVREEASQIYYSLNTFNFRMKSCSRGKATERWLLTWLSHLSPTDRLLLRRIRLDDTAKPRRLVAERGVRARARLAMEGVQIDQAEILVKVEVKEERFHEWLAT